MTKRRIAALQRNVVPGDFNNDGITDLAGTQNVSGPAPVIVALGRADGSFAAPLTTVASGAVLATGDFDDDGHLDIVSAAVPAPDEQVLVAFGNGDGTFDNGGEISAYYEAVYAETADVDGDGHLDIVLSGHGEPSRGVEIIAGNGDRTFAAGRSVATAAGAAGLAVADLDGDGQPDIAVANRGDGSNGGSVSVLRNNGGLLFTQSQTLATGNRAHDAAIGDLNRDGQPDIVAVTDAGIVVWINEGEGTFPGSPDEYALGPPATNPITVALGDLNRDGLLDVATGNRHSAFVNDCRAGFKGVNTVAVIPGLGTGALHSAFSTFAVGDQMDPEGWKGGAISLYLADTSRDGRLDVVVGYGDRLVTNDPDPNWGPTVTLGPDVTQESGDAYLRARVSDVDQDAVTYSWTHSGGRSVPPVPNPCVSGLASGTHTFTVTVNDGQGHTATDSVTYTIGSGGGPPAGSITVTAPRAGDVMPVDGMAGITWTVSDLSGVSSFWVEWSETSNGSMVTGEACRDLPASARSCSWQYPRFPRENVRVIVHARDSGGRTIASGQSGAFRIEGWSSGSVGTGSGSVSEAPNRGFVVRDRGAAGSDIWGTADSFTWVYREMTGDFTAFATITDVQGAHHWTKVGVMLRQSLDPGSPHHFVLASEGRGLAYQRRLTQGGISYHTGLGSSPLPVTVQVGRIGSRIYMNLERTSGAFERVAEAEFGDGPILLGLPVGSHSTAWSTGIFEDVEVDSGPVVNITAPADGEVITAGEPYTIRFSATDDHGIEYVEVFASTDDGATWTLLCTSEPPDPGANECDWFTPGPPTEQARVRVIAYSYRNDQGEDVTGRFSIRAGGGNGLPSGWSNHDIGAVGAAGSASYDAASGTFTVEGSGADVWGTADELHYAHQTITGNFDIVARVASVENLHRWTKAGLMIREHLGAGARHGFVIATPRTERGVVFQRRATEGGTSTSTASIAVAPPVWLRLTRNTDLIEAFYRRSPSEPWVSLGIYTYAGLSPTLHVGFAVSSHVDGQLATARFDSVSVTRTGS